MGRLIEWDGVGQKKFETGNKNGVIYRPDANGNYTNGVAWNGLTAVNENPSGGDATDLWADDIKYATMRAAEKYGVTIECYTYPDEFAECNGEKEVISGVKIGQQARKPFGFSYVSTIGNDVEGTDFAEKLHLIYGLTASPSSKGYSTINDSPDAITFSFEAESTPVNVTDGKPTSSIEIDSSKVDSTKFEALKNILYGTAATYAATSDVTFETGKTYYEKQADGSYVKTSDQTMQSGKTYYEQTAAAVAARLPFPDEVISTLSTTVGG